MKKTIPDLTRRYPRSPHIKLGPFVHLPRMIDKARAKGADLLGEYLYPCPLDQCLLEFLEIGGQKFLDLTKEYDDEEILSWLRENRRNHAQEEIEKWNDDFLNRKPQGEDEMKRFKKIQEQIAPNKKDISTWIELLDIDEGRSLHPGKGQG
ncbi:MAG: DUF5069 domain-containing protein [Nitrospiria bacterium]